MKKRTITVLLSVVFLATACQHPQAPLNNIQEQNISAQSITTDFYTVQISPAWHWEVVDYGDDVPTSDVIFYDDKQHVIGGADIVVAIHDALADLPNKIRVLGEEVTENGWIIGKTETVDNAVGGDTTSQYHVLIPLENDWQMHEYIDLYLDGQQFSLEQIQALAETVVIRQQQLFGYVLSIEDNQLCFRSGQYVTAEDEGFQLTEAEKNQGFAIIAIGEQQILPLSPGVCYYLIDAENSLFQEVELSRFVENLQMHPEKVYDLTLQDGLVISVEERML